MFLAVGGRHEASECGIRRPECGMQRGGKRPNDFGIFARLCAGRFFDNLSDSEP